MSQTVTTFAFLGILALGTSSIAQAGVITMPVDPGGRATIGLYQGLQQERIFLEAMDDEDQSGSETFTIPQEIQDAAGLVRWGTLLDGKHVIKSAQLKPGDTLSELEPFSIPQFAPTNPEDDDLGMRFELDFEMFEGVGIGSVFEIVGGSTALLPQVSFFAIDPADDPAVVIFDIPFEGTVAVRGFTDFSPLPVPEPSTTALGFVGVIGLAGMIWFGSRSRRLRLYPHSITRTECHRF